MPEDNLDHSSDSNPHFTALVVDSGGIQVLAGGIVAPVAALVAGDKYVVIGPDGTFRVSAIGPAS